jgi:hypothetical protein
MAEIPEKAAAAAMKEVVKGGMVKLKGVARHWSVSCYYEDPDIRIRVNARQRLKIEP